MKYAILSTLLTFCLGQAQAQNSSQDDSDWPVKKILQLEVNSSINPATYNYFKSGFERAQSERFDFILITMNTPGGLVTTTKDILTLFGQSDIPVMVWVKPEGASATSAGALISSGAHLLFMASGTNIGAAAPVMMGKDIDPGGNKNPLDSLTQKDKKKDAPKKPQNQALKGASDMKKKAVNDLVALVKSLSEARGRNGELFADMVSKAKSFTAKKAHEGKIIDGVANHYRDIFAIAKGKTIKIKGVAKKILIDGEPLIVNHSMSLGLSLLDIFANPSLAYLLFLIGAALIYFELQAPGGLIAGSIGAICLLLAGIGFQVLPLNFGALGLILLAFVLFVLEMYVTSFGLLSLAGIISLIFGSLFLYHGGDAGVVALDPVLIASTTGGIILFVLFLGFYLLKDWKQQKNKKGLYDIVGKEGLVTVVKPASKSGEHLFSVKISGEIWKALSTSPLEVDDKVVVTKHCPESLQIEVKKV